MTVAHLAPLDEDGLRPLLHETRRAPRRNPVGAWLSTRHAFWVEGVALVALYVVYDAGRGLAGGGRQTAIRHARSVADAEQHLHLNIERSVQQTATHVPGLIDLFGFGYATFHLGVTIAVLSWLWFSHPARFARVRTTLVVTTLLALAGFTIFPTAPPRLAGIGVHDSLSLGQTTAHSAILRLLYNPYAALPSVHIAFAVIAGGAVATYAHHRPVRIIGALYPVFVAVEVLATGNHFVLDVLAGVAIDLVAVTVASRLVTTMPSIAPLHPVATIHKLRRTALGNHPHGKAPPPRQTNQHRSLARSEVVSPRERPHNRLGPDHRGRGCDEVLRGDAGADRH